MPTTTDIREKVSGRYGEIAQTGGASCCGDASSETALRQHAAAIGYDPDELAELPMGVNLGLGCGNPTSLTLIDQGMTVLDLGSGTGVDCFLAAKRVGPASAGGKVIGLDMTDAMLEKATQYAADHGYDNVEFRKGYIEQMPVEDASVDLIISNCVINLSPDKAKVFEEIARVLKPGGQAAISDIVLLQPLPESLLEDFEAYTGCISGAVMLGDYLGCAIAAGLDIVKSQRKGYDVVSVLGCSPEGAKLLDKMPADFDGNAYVTSLDLLARKPAAVQQAVCDPAGGCC